MAKRHEIIGIKQAIRFEWMQKTANLLLAGLDSKTIRQELHEFLSRKKGDGSEGLRSEKTRTFAVNNLMKIWVSPDPVLLHFRDASLVFLHENPSLGIAVHWGMISAAYPFWFNVARQTGRLLALQDQVTQTQIINRMKERYGDRQTIFRYTRYVLRSFVAWGILEDSQTKGCYEISTFAKMTNPKLTVLFIEAALHAIPEGRSSLDLLLNAPGFFPFQSPVVTGDFISLNSDQIDVDHYGFDSDLLKLRNM